MTVPNLRLRRVWAVAALGGALCVWSVSPWSVLAQTKTKPPAAAPKSTTKPAGDPRAQDTAGIQKTVEALIEAFGTGDAAAAAATLTEGAELIPADGGR